MLTALAGCGSVSAANSAGGSGLSGSTDAAELETPTPGINTFLGTTNVAFTWTTGSGATAYELTLGTTGPGSSDIADSGSITGTSTTVNSIPANGVTVYATLNSRIGGKWRSIGYTYSESKPVSVKALTCASGSILGAGTDTCTVELSAAAPTGGEAVILASNNTAVTVPPSVTVAAGAVSAGFQAEVSSVCTAQTGTFKVTLASTTASYVINLGGTVPTLNLSVTSLNFGTVNVASTTSQPVILTSSGTGAVTVSAGSVSGAGFTLSGVSFPLTLNSGQTATLTIGFDPTTAGAASGAVTLTSNSSTGTTSTIALSGTGQSVPYQVNITWDAPASSTDPVAGYNIYRTTSGGSSYSLLNSSVNSSTSYIDTTVADGNSYTYYIESVDAEGNQSSPSNTFTVSIP